MALRQNDLESANRWYKKEIEILPDASHTEYEYYFAYATSIRLWIAQALQDQDFDKLQRAENLAEYLLAAAQEHGRGKDVIELLTLKALVCYLRGDHDLALDSIDRALALAKPEGFIRVFVEEGPPMADLLTYALQNGLHPEYIQQLLAEFPQPAQTVSMIEGLMEPEDVLTPRQTEILAAIADGLSTQQIVEEFVISPHTARTHIKNIFERLEVHNRVQAVEVARERKLI
jgi:LuxR family maltose regulon positive regulatory protein